MVIFHSYVKLPEGSIETFLEIDGPNYGPLKGDIGISMDLSKRHPHHIRQKLWRVIITILDSQLPTAAKDARHSCERPSSKTLEELRRIMPHAPSGINISIALTFT